MNDVIIGIYDDEIRKKCIIRILRCVHIMHFRDFFYTYFINE
jgi:hypothetical protein